MLMHYPFALLHWAFVEKLNYPGSGAHQLPRPGGDLEHAAGLVSVHRCVLHSGPGVSDWSVTGVRQGRVRLSLGQVQVYSDSVDCSIE